jgi:hypothetical protein
MKWKKFDLPADAAEVLENAPGVLLPDSLEEIVDLAVGGADSNSFDVAYDVPGKGSVVEANVVRVKNGIAANYPEAYMRRRDPDCMFIADELPTNKPTFETRFGYQFDDLRKETLAWLANQELAVFGFYAGHKNMGAPSIVIAPSNAGFFAFGLALLQGMIPYKDIPEDFKPQSVIFVAPPYRHTHFEGRQVVVHHRQQDLHELFSYNLYPGPSAKKGIYGVLIGLGEKESWVTAHCSTVQVITPYDNVVTIMHEGASGGGKSEMLEQPHREDDGRLLLGVNTVTGEKRRLEIPRFCTLNPVTDDMALCHPTIQNGQGKMTVADAEDAWFLRVNHIDNYGTDPHLERVTAFPKAPVLFLNIDAVPGSRAMIWEHTMDEPGKPCPNPRVVVPRENMPGIVNDPVAVDIRSFGVRTPPCTQDHPTYGIIGLFHLLPPSLAWLWRLVAPRGHANPSIVDSEGMSSEGVGSYWPFATGRRVDQANLLLKQFTEYRRTQYVLIPNQYIGAWHVGFMGEWIAREYLSRRGLAPFPAEQVRDARCPLLGQTLYQMQIEGRMIPRWFLQVDSQPEVGQGAYDEGAKMLEKFFRHCLLPFYNDSDLDPLGRKIIECCLENGAVADYQQLIPSAKY